MTRPVLSVIVAIDSDTATDHAETTHLAGCLEAFGRQAGARAIEIIVPFHDNVRGIDAVRTKHPEVRFVPVDGMHVAALKGGSREHHDTLRARGLAVATGEIVALFEDHARPADDWCTAVIAAHREGPAAIGGAIGNAVDRPLNWAVFFCDFGRYQNPVPAGPSRIASDTNVSYKRIALDAIRPAWEHTFREVIVHEALLASGATLVLDPSIVAYQHRDDLHLGRALRERFIWGRSYGLTRGETFGAPKRMFYAAACALLPGILVGRMTATAWERGHFGTFLVAFPLVVLLQTMWALGEGAGYLTAATTHSAEDVPRGPVPAATQKPNQHLAKP